jgi:hypothetical protein
MPPGGVWPYLISELIKREISRFYAEHRRKEQFRTGWITGFEDTFLLPVQYIAIHRIRGKFAAFISFTLKVKPATRFPGSGAS